ncbi:MAG: hypothetical protein AB2404_05875 [Planifilum fimeticola]
MDNYFELLRRHGWILWVSFCVGYLAAGVITGIAAVIIVFLGAIILFVSANDVLNELGASLNSFPPDPAAILEKLFSPGIVIPLLITIVLFIGIMLLYAGFTNAGMNTMMRNAVFEGRSSIETYFTQGFRYMLKMTGQLFLTGLFYLPAIILLAVGVFLFAYGIAEGGAPSVLMGLLLSLLSAALFIVLALVFLHAPVILVTENTGIWESIALSARLFVRSFGQVFLSGLIVFLIYLAYGVFFFILGAIIGISTFDPSGADPTETSLGLELFFNLLQYVLNPLMQVLALLAVFLRYRNRLRPRLFPEESDDGGEIGGTKTIWK